MKIGMLAGFVIALWAAEAKAASQIEIPVRLREGLLWLEVRASGGAAPLNFLLDTGASVSVLDVKTVRRLGLALGRPVGVSGVGTSLTGHWPVRWSARTEEVPLPEQFLALDLSMLSTACKQRIDGLVGADFFRNRVVQIDFEAERLRLLDSAPNAGQEHVVPLQSRRCGLRVMVGVNGRAPEWVRLDTGCATPFHWVPALRQPAGCTSKIAVGLAELSIPQAETTVTLGKQEFDRVPTGLHRETIFPGEAGLLGNGLLTRFQSVTIDAVKGRLLLGPRRTRD